MEKKNCYYCDLEYTKSSIKKNEKVLCPRCNKTLYEYESENELFLHLFMQ